MSKAIVSSLISMMLIVSCECKDMQWRKLPEEKRYSFHRYPGEAYSGSLLEERCQ